MVRLSEPLERKNLPLLKFEETVGAVIADFAKNLPNSFTRCDLASEIELYLDHARQRIRLPRGAGRRDVRAIDIDNYLVPRFAGENFELTNQEDFKRAGEPLLTDDNFLMLGDMMKSLIRCSSELGLSWNQAEMAIRQVAGKLRPDKRPDIVVKGDF